MSRTVSLQFSQFPVVLILFLPIIIFLSTVPRLWFRNPYTVIVKFFHLSMLRVPPGSVRVFLFPFRENK